MYSRSKLRTRTRNKTSNLESKMGREYDLHMKCDDFIVIQ